MDVGFLRRRMHYLCGDRVCVAHGAVVVFFPVTELSYRVLRFNKYLSRSLHVAQEVCCFSEETGCTCFFWYSV